MRGGRTGYMISSAGSKNTFYTAKFICPERHNFFVTLVVTLVVCVSIIEEFTDYFLIKYVDEIFTLFAAFGVLFNYKKLKSSKIYFSLFETQFFALLVLATIGIISNINSRLIGATPILIDAFSLLKAPVSFTYVLCIAGSRDKRLILDILSALFAVMTFVAFCMGVLNLFADIGMDYDIRYGLRSFKFYFNNPGGLTICMLCSYAVFCRNNGLTYTILRYMSLAVILLTLRTVAICTVGAVITMKFLFGIKKFKIKYVIFIIIGLIIIAVIVWPKTKSYLFGKSVRNSFIEGAIYVSKKYFPIGSGFATFGSDQAFKHYSALYYELRFHYDNALGPTSTYMNDNFYPMLLAQFGIAGIVCYGVLLVSQFRATYLLIKADNSSPLLAIGAFAILLCAFFNSLGAAIYTSAFGVLLYVVLALILPQANNKLLKESRYGGNPY
ncbi:MAG: hypothetical protein NC311_07440 [Muribaculaceae bacterium]|nr:hypothetical protein [Muribaculaceae bacterium]